jgi:hypothetical protein
MIHHFSITARSPAHVAAILAEVLGGRSFPFSVFPGSHIAIADDPFGTAVEVYPLGTELVPGGRGDGVHAVTKPQPGIFSGTHAALSVSLSEEAIKTIARREEWRAVTCERRDFQVIEFWIENRILIELLTPAMAEDYRRAMTPERLNEYARYLGAR